MRFRKIGWWSSGGVGVYEIFVAFKLRSISTSAASQSSNILWWWDDSVIVL